MNIKNWKLWFAVVLICALLISAALADGRVELRRIGREKDEAISIDIGTYYFVDLDLGEGWFTFTTQEAGLHFFTCKKNNGQSSAASMDLKLHTQYREQLMHIHSGYMGDSKDKATIGCAELEANTKYYIEYDGYCAGQISICSPSKHIADGETYTADGDVCLCGEPINRPEPTVEIQPLATEKPKKAQSYELDFGDDIAIRILPDGSIEATVEEYDQADWNVFKHQGDTWSTKFTDEEYRAEIDSYASMDSFHKMQAKGKYISVSANCYGTLAGVTEDGRIAFNSRSEKRYWVDESDPKWSNLTDVALGSYSVIALKQDGTIACHEGNGSFAKGTHPSQWKDVAAIENDMIAVGLRKDGTVYYSAHDVLPWYPDEYVSLDTISTWTDIVQVDSSWDNVVALKADGTVVAAGDNHMGKIDVSSWKDIKKIAVGMNHVVGLKEDGTIISTIPNSLLGMNGGANGEDLQNVVDVYANRNYTLAILADGNVCLLDTGIDDGISYDGAWAAADWKF